MTHDLAAPDSPVSIAGWIALGLSDRKAAQLQPFVPVCCDNMVSNGRKLGQAVSAFAERNNPELARWIDTNYPNRKRVGDLLIATR